MTRTRKAGVVLAVLAAIAVLLCALVFYLVPSDEELAARAAAQLQAALGVKVNVGALHWHLFPVPSVVVENVATLQARPIVVSRLTAYPALGALWQRRIRLDRVEVQSAELPQLSLRQLHGAGAGGAQGWTLDDIPLVRLVARDVTWISRRGIAVVYDGEADFDSGWRPRQAALRRPDFKPETQLTLTRQGDEDRWAVLTTVGGGTAHGEVQLKESPAGRFHLEGKLQPRGIEVASALAAFNRRSVIAGKASGETTLSAQGDNVVGLARSLHTRTAFTLGRSTLLRFDLNKAIRTAGREHAGQTALNAVTGQLDTQNTPEGMVVEYTNVKTSSGAFTASGHGKIANRQIDAEVAVDLVDGLVGVPLKVTGSLDNVKFSVPAGAVAGAAVGTAVLPGIGTALGARIGSTLGRIFGSGPAPPPEKPAGGPRRP